MANTPSKRADHLSAPLPEDSNGDFPSQGAGARGLNANSLTELFHERALAQPHNTAYTFLVDGEDHTLVATYREIDQRARAIAGRLQQLGYQDERALLLYDSGLEYIAALVGCLYAGVVAVPVYPPDPMRMARMGPRLQAIASDCDARLVLGIGEDLQRSAPLLNTFAQLETRLATDEIDKTLADTWSPVALNRDSLAILQYTSGSTGTPKGVMLRHGNLLHNLSQIEQKLDIPNAVAAAWLPLYHDLGLIGFVLQAWYSGRPMILMSPIAFFQRPIRWLRTISKYRATTTGAPDFGYDLCVQRIKPDELRDLDLSCWKVAISGAEPVRAETIDRFVKKFGPCGVRREIFRPCYGLAEATLMVTSAESISGEFASWFDVESLATRRAIRTTGDTKHARRLVRCGHTPERQHLAIVDPNSLTELPETSLGEVWVRGPNIAGGYWNRPEETEATFNAHLPDGQGPFLRTGDVGFLDDGSLFLTGRLKDLIIISGNNHHPEDIERTVENSYAALRPYSGAVFSMEHHGRERVIVVHEVARPKKHDLDAILDDIRRDVFTAHDIVVDRVILISSGTLPKTSSGKVQRSVCREYLENNRFTILRQWMAPCFAEADQNAKRPEYVAPRSQTEALMATVWEEVFGLDQVGIDDDFFALGGHSLLATQLAARLEPQLGITIELSELLECPTIAQLVHRIEARQLEQEHEEAALLDRLESMSDSEAAALLAEQDTEPMSNNTTCQEPQPLDYLIIGAGPAGLQLGYYLQRAGRDYAILERGSGAGTFFRQYPRHRKLLSINKIHTGCNDPEVNLRWDWNSLLTEDASRTFREYSSDYFPDADDLVRYLEDFARETEQNIHFNADVMNIARKDERFDITLADGRRFTSRVLVVATGCNQPYVPEIEGIELAENYAEVSVDPNDFICQRVLILGKGNSAFETADRLIPSASLIHLASPETIKLAWKTHFVGDLRAVNNNLLDTYQLKSQNALLDARVERICKVGDHYEVSFSYAHASGEQESMEYDRVIVCTGFQFDASSFDATCRPELVIDNRFPNQTSRWESTNIPDLYFAGGLMQARDFKKKQSGFIHGFRYNVQALSRMLAETYEGEPLEHTTLPLDPEAIAEHMLDRINGNSALWQQTGFFGDLIIVDRTSGAARYYKDLPVDYMHDSNLGESEHYLVLTMEFGQQRIDSEPDVFAISRVHKDDTNRAEQSTAIHPIVRGYSKRKQVTEHHVIEDLLSVWKEPVHREPLVDYLRAELTSHCPSLQIALDQPKGHTSAPVQSR